MNTKWNIGRWGCSCGAFILSLALAACSGSKGDPGPAGAAGPQGPSGGSVGVVSPADAKALTITVDSVTVASPPVVNFTVTNENDVPVVGFSSTDFRFNIAKLIPGVNGDPSTWQNYINRASGGAIQGSQERNRTGFPWGTLVDNKNGTYKYTFATDITSSTANPCPSPCTDASGKALDISYQPTLTHRVSIQQGNSSYPKSNATYDFVPGGGTVSTDRIIVDTAKCNQCHNQLTAHGSRIDTKLCVTCHNPGSWIAGSGGAPNTSVDFKVYIHKIHRGENLPSVEAGTPYKIGNADFSNVAFPQDIRNCTKCHDGADTASPQGDNWETHPSMEACGSCHDDVYFGATPDPAKPYQTVAHPGGVVTDNSECLTCHAANRIAGSIAEKHSYPVKLAAASGKYKLNVVSVANSAPGAMPTITFSITDPTNSNAAYDIANTASITAGSMNLIVGWNTTDINNSGRSNAQPISLSLLSGGALSSAVTNNGDGTYSITSTTAIAADATGSGRVGFYARMSTDVDGDGTADTVPVKSVVKDFLITGSAIVARRTVVDITKCDNCHQQLSLHGEARTDEPQLCVMCHNPNATDTARRPAAAPTGTLDGKKEEAIDFKRLIHGIHAGAETLYSGASGEGFRTKGLVVFGYPGAATCLTNGVYTCQNDFSDVRFPGILNDCATCHTGTSYQLTGVWDSAAQNGIQGSTIDHGASLTDQSDDLKISPTAAVCSSCHDDALAQQHMISTGGALFSATQMTISGNLETCSVCHGPGGIVDVKTVHGVQ